jgi:N-(2-amino-2-carboxyethyl)-L-glutamate synthase
MHESILSTIGNTPLVKLSRIFRDATFSLFAKLEGFNPGGSIKDRTAHSIIRNALDSGIIEPGATIIESSSGNLGIGLAQICRYYGLRLICVVDPKTTSQNREILRTYGAMIDCVTEPHAVTGEFLQARLDRVQMLLDTIEGSFWPNQYANIYNPLAHHYTMNEIALELDGDIDYLFCAASTCGTLRGCAEYIREHGLKTQVVAVDAVGSVIFGGKPGKRLIPGHGAALRPRLFQPGLADECIYVSDLDCIVGCRRLVERESILAGGSSGAVIMAIDLIKDRIPAAARCVAILADRGERYLDTIYSDDWVSEHFGDLSPILDHKQEAQSWVMI